MRVFYNLSLLLSSFLLITSCSDASYKFKLNSPKKAMLGEKISISFKQLEGNQIDSIHIYINSKSITTANTTSINTNDIGTGRHKITALAFVPGQVKKVNNTIEILAKQAPSGYNYKIVNTYPHDVKAYTQGLEYHNGFLYETTGRRGQSWLRKVELETGKVLMQKDLDEKYFGEGMTIFNDEISWLTWQASKGFTYNLTDFKQTGEFKYQKSSQGWGLTHNNTELIKSDGTNKIWFLDPITKKEKRSIQVYTDKFAMNNLNELEYINGKIFANYWLTGKGNKVKSVIAIINPESGAVEGTVYLTELRNTVLKDQKLEGDDVLNGIAYDSENDRLFVTGKHWGKLFEIELTKN